MKPTLTIGHFPIIDHLTLGVAKKHDGEYFKNFNLETKLFRNWQKLCQDITNGAVHGAFILFPLAMELFRAGVDIKIVLLGHREGQVLVVSNEIKSVRDLKGKTVFIPHRFSIHNILLHQILKRAGLNPLTDVIYKEGFDDVREITQNLITGKVQAFIAAEPFGTEVVRAKKGRIILLSNVMKAHHIDCVLVLKGEVIKNFPVASNELVQSLVKAGMFINAYPRQAAEIGEHFLEVNSATLLQAITHDKGHIVFWDLLPRFEDFAEPQDFAIKEMRLWDKPINLSKLIYPEFAYNSYREWVIDLRRGVKDKGEERTLPGNFNESMARINSFFHRAIPAVGVRLIRPKERYPRITAPRTSFLEHSCIDFLDRAFKGEQIVFTGISKEIKGVYIMSASESSEPDRVILKLSKEEAVICSKALSFGGDHFKLKEFDEHTSESELFYKPGIAILLKDGLVICALDYVTLRFLSLLLYF